MLSFALPYIEENYPEGIDKIGYFGQPGDDPEDHGGAAVHSMVILLSLAGPAPVSSP